MEKVSVIIPAYNKAQLTVRTVQSVLNQTHPHIETIVVDDGSTDHTQQALSVFENRIKYVYKENGGACSARNLGIRLAEGKYIAFLDCDDIYLPNKIELSVDCLEKNKEVGLVHTAAYFINENDTVVGHYSHPQSRHQGWIAHRLILKNFICNSTILVRKECLEKTGFFDEAIFTPADWDLWIRLAEVCQVRYLNIPLTKYRIIDNYIFNRLELAAREEKIVIENFFKRNPNISPYFKRKIKSNLHLRFAQCYFLKNDPLRLKEEFIAAVLENFFNFKAIFLLIYYFLARKSLKGVLTKKILRGA